MKITAILLLLALPAEAADPLAFSGRIQNESLAEEAIDLLHCLADSYGLPWELSEEKGAAYALRLEEKGGLLLGSFRSPSGTQEVRLGKGESNRVCSTLAENMIGTQQESANKNIDENMAGKISKAPALPEKDWEPEEPKHDWLWIGAAAALLAGGFILWKSQPDHRSFRMD